MRHHDSAFMFCLCLVLHASVCAQTSSPARVISVSIRGAADAALDSLLTHHEFEPHSALMKMSRADYLAPLENAETSAALATAETGAWPATHGIVGNAYRRNGSAFEESLGGFDKQIESETLWQAAARQGKHVIRLSAFYLDGYRGERHNVRTLAQSLVCGPSKFIALIPEQSQTPFSATNAFEHVQALRLSPTSADSLTLVITSKTNFALKLHALAVDTAHDGERRFHALVLDDDRDLQNGFHAKLHAREWAPLTLQRNGVLLIGTWIKLLAFSSDLATIKLYVRSPQQSRGYPEAFVAALETRLGFPPGGPNAEAFNNGLLDEQTLLEESERETQYVTAAAKFCLQDFPFDLMTLDYALLDRLGHSFYLTEPRQQEYDDDRGHKRARFMKYIFDGYQHANVDLSELMSNAGASTAWLVTSEYGFTPAHSRIALNSLLQQAGMRAPQVRAITGSVSAHIYVNLHGREPNGAVAPEAYQDVLEKIISTASNFRDVRSGEAVFDKILRKNELHQIGLNHTHNAGDVWVRLKPGYTFSNALNASGLFDKPRFLGEHGYTPRSRAAHGIFYYHGLGARRLRKPVVHAADVAATLSALLGIKPARGNAGQNVFTE